MGLKNPGKKVRLPAASRGDEQAANCTQPHAESPLTALRDGEFLPLSIEHCSSPFRPPAFYTGGTVLRRTQRSHPCRSLEGFPYFSGMRVWIRLQREPDGTRSTGRVRFRLQGL
jgi:hypothetical protein